MVKNSLPCYGLHPELFPFIGKNYPKAPLKVLFLGESHYLPAAYNHKVGRNGMSVVRQAMVIGKVYGEVFAKGDYPQALEYIAFGNYFLRPAEVCGESIVIVRGGIGG